MAVKKAENKIKLKEIEEPKESNLEKALRLSNDQLIAMAIRDLLISDPVPVKLDRSQLH